MPTATVTLQTPHALLSDIQIWSDAATALPVPDDSLSYVAAVNHRKIPLFLVSCGPYNVYSEHLETEDYFFESLVCSDKSTGMLAKSTSENAENYVVFYVDRTSGPHIRCYYIDFAVLEQSRDLRQFAGENPASDLFVASKFRGNAARSDTSVFDRVLDFKTSKKGPSHASKQSPVAVSSALITSHQISQAVSKVVLSGLRLRGLSTNSSANNKIAIREIYQMTKKAAIFALRKYSYEFNDGSPEEKKREQGVCLADIQSIVESLLATFVDVEGDGFSERNGGMG